LTTIILAQAELSSLQNIFLYTSAVAGMLAILSLKKIHASISSQLGISSSFSANIRVRNYVTIVIG
jgi:hypothetical protein